VYTGETVTKLIEISVVCRITAVPNFIVVRTVTLRFNAEDKSTSYKTKPFTLPLEDGVKGKDNK
jgi:hypothetical protein